MVSKTKKAIIYGFGIDAGLVSFGQIQIYWKKRLTGQANIFSVFFQSVVENIEGIKAKWYKLP